MSKILIVDRFGFSSSDPSLMNEHVEIAKKNSGATHHSIFTKGDLKEFIKEYQPRYALLVGNHTKPSQHPDDVDILLDSGINVSGVYL
jgi:hypothetical protein